LVNGNEPAVIDFLIDLLNYPYCFDKVHGIFKNCTYLNDLDRGLIPTLSSTLGMSFISCFL